MNNQFFVATARLSVWPLEVSDAAFIFELLNSEGWIKFIGNRNINDENDAVDYIKKILANNNLNFWVVRLLDDKSKIGIVTFIKRDYLQHHDIGFAFLPKYFGKGYAFEATNAVIKKLIKQNQLSILLATTLPENVDSIGLLKKLGFVFEKEIAGEKELLHLYQASAEIFSTGF
jgi:ribosomal-protein-alanine N-acetyltransferase